MIFGPTEYIPPIEVTVKSRRFVVSCSHFSFVLIGKYLKHYETDSSDLTIALYWVNYILLVYNKLFLFYNIP